MGYFRLRDIRTPPFAYVLNMEHVIRTCGRCHIPFQELDARLEIAICQMGPDAMGKPMMADHWLIGDQFFAARLASLLPGQFRQEPILVVSTSHKEPDREPAMALDGDAQPEFFFFLPVSQIELAPKFRERFPPIECDACQRNFPEIPIDFQPTPDEQGAPPEAATLKGFYLEGYNYLFHDRVVTRLMNEFPEMMLEKLIYRESVI